MKLFFETTDALNFLLEKLELFDSSILLKDPCSLCNINRNLWREKLEHDLNYANKKYFFPRFSSIIFLSTLIFRTRGQVFQSWNFEEKKNIRSEQLLLLLKYERMFDQSLLINKKKMKRCDIKLLIKKTFYLHGLVMSVTIQRWEWVDKRGTKYHEWKDLKGFNRRWRNGSSVFCFAVSHCNCLKAKAYRFARNQPGK